MLRTQNAAPLADVERYSEVQVSNPHIGVQHLKNGLAYVFVGHIEGAVVPDKNDEIRAAMDALLEEYRRAEPKR